MANEALKRACDFAGGQKPLADRIGTSQSMVWYWIEKSKKGTPAEFCSRIVDAIDGQVSLHELRPDIYPAPEETESAA